MVYDFKTDKVTEPLQKLMQAHNIRTSTAGLYTLLPDGSSMIEDVTEARLFIAGRDGRTLAEYVNRATDGEIYHLGWSRFIGKAQGDAILNNIQKVKCDA